MKELIVSLVPYVSTFAAIIVTVIGFIRKVKTIVGETTVENAELKRQINKQNKKIDELIDSNSKLTAELGHVTKQLNKVKEK